MNFGLGFWELSELVIKGYPENAIGALTIGSNEEGRVAFHFASATLKCRGMAKTLMIEAASPVTTADSPVRGPRIFSYPNVWNSCLLLARAKGFSIKLTGNPDQQGSISCCRWVASKEDRTELTADNPIELAGLIALYEYHRPKQDASYWWRIDGPNLVEELQEQWAERYFGPTKERGAST
jgi:hypothetical protein